MEDGQTLLQLDKRHIVARLLSLYFHMEGIEIKIPLSYLVTADPTHMYPPCSCLKVGVSSSMEEGQTVSQKLHRHSFSPGQIRL